MTGRPRVWSLPRHLYVHVPFCRSKCAYCDFFSVVPEVGDSCAAYVAETLSTAAELAGRARAAGLRALPLRTLYVGGGTPTLLGEGLVALVSGLVSLFELNPGAEVTVEANPESCTETLVAQLAEAGVTRVSVGMQSLNADVLAWLGRPHSAQDALRAARAVLDAGLELSVDLIAGVPSSSPAVWSETLAEVVALGPGHVSVYPLTVEDDTPLAAAIASGALDAPDEDGLANAMLVADKALGAAGLERYEIANYALPGHESRHNTAYWTGRPYLALGGGAHGMVPADVARALGIEDAPPHIARVRYAYSDTLVPDRTPTFTEFLTAAEAAREDAMLGLRLTRGIDGRLAEAACAREALTEVLRDGLAEFVGGRWRLTARGRLLGNEVFGRVWNG